MMTTRWSKLLLAMLMIAAFAFVGCSDDDDNGGTGPLPVDQFETVRTAVDGFLAGPTPITSVSAYVANLADGDATNNPFVLSVRSAAHYEAGHIPGAINVPWRDLGNPTNLAALPTDQPILDYCYTGHTGQVASVVLGVMGYEVSNLKFGMMAWNDDPAILNTAPYSMPAPGAPIETTANVPTETYELPDLDVTTSSDAAAIIQAAVAAYLAGASPVTSVSAYQANLADGNDANNPLVVSVRSADHYATGHIPGAINIPWKDIAKVENLRKLPPDQPILVYCYTGHTGQIAATALGLLGYDASNLKYGMSGWTADDTYMGGVARYSGDIDGAVNTGPNP